jgi:hypothetical protein
MLVPILIIITVLFIAILGVKRVLSLKVCALCGSIVLTWIGLLFLYRTGYFRDAVLLSLLMGQSITGLYYTVDKRVPSALRIFTLPFFLTLTVIFYIAIVGTNSIFLPLLVLLVLWMSAYGIFAYRNDPGKKSISDAVMNCCEDK